MVKKITVFIVFAILFVPPAHSQNSDSVFGEFKENSGERYQEVQERKQEIQETREARRLKICENLEDKIDTKVSKFYKNRDTHVERYKHLKDRLERIAGLLEGKGFNVEQLEKDLLVLDELIKEYAKIYTDFVDSLKFTKGYACGKSEGDFKDSLGKAKEARDLVKAKREEIREFYKNVIREDIKELRQQALSMEEVEEVKEATSSEE